MNKKRIDALTVKKGPTESGGGGPAPQQYDTYVGGEIFQIDKLSVFISNYWLLILLLILPLGFLLFKKKYLIPLLIKH